MMLSHEFRGVLERKWNSEHPLIFAAVILQRSFSVKGNKDIKTRIQHRLNLWEDKKFEALVSDVELEQNKKISIHLDLSDDDKF